MKFAAILKSLLLLTAASLLVACGGGSSGGDSIFQPPSIRITATPSASSASPGQAVEVQVRVTNATGNAVADGTSVNATVAPGNSGTIRYVSPNGALSDASSGPTAGGTVNFRYTAGGSGNITLTFSTAGSAGTATTNVTIAVSGTSDQRLQISTARTQIPLNRFWRSELPFWGSPFISEVTVTVKDGNGNPVSKEDGLDVHVNPAERLAYSKPDDPDTDCDLTEGLDGCEFHTLMTHGTVHVMAGKATLFIHSLDIVGVATLTVTFHDEVTNQTITATQDFEVVSSLPPLPDRLSLGVNGPIYVQGSGGNSSARVSVRVYDADGRPVPDPEAAGMAYNNYRIEIVGASGSAAPRLNGVDATGTSVGGQAISLRTVAGQGAANFIAGDEVGSFVIRLTADRADNNVDNGISDPVTVERSVVVSDGRLFDLEITQPTINVLTINPAGGDIEVVDIGGEEIALPISPDGTYSVTVGVIATDRLGNPVLPGTQIRFGLIDEPQTIYGAGDFYIAGGDGDPQEGGTLFTATDGRFTTAGGGVGPGDTLVIMAENVIGNRDLEAARTVTEVHSQTRLSVDYRFNHNDTTGQSVDYRDILPYIVGRAADGNIVATATTNEIGVATTKMNYPVRKLGKIAVIWAQGDGPVVAGQPKKVTDVEYARFSAVAPAMIVVSPSILPANGTYDVQICVYDALRAPIGNVPVDFAFQGLQGQGWVDDFQMSGTVIEPTLIGNGCTTATVRTQGVLEGDDEPELIFTGAGAQASITFTFQPMVLLANPSMMRSGGEVLLTLINNNGAPQPGHQIVGTCEGENGTSAWLDPQPGVTNASGQTTTTIRANNLNQFGAAGSATCTFETADGSASAEVKLQGEDLCLSYVSPLPPGCQSEPEPEPETHSLSVTIQAGAIAGSYTLVSAPAAVNCSVVSGSPSACSPSDFNDGVQVTLTATAPACAPADPGCTPGGIPNFLGWSGDCVQVGPNPLQARVQMSGNRSCTARWQ